MRVRAWIATLILLWAGAAHARTVRLLLAVGDNIGDPADPPLRFADADARHLSEVMVELGQVAPERAYLLVNARAREVRERFAELSGRIAELTAAGAEVQLFVYASAHADAGALHLRGTHLPLTELRALAEASRAQVRVLIIDSCDSGAAARAKGGTLGADYAVSLRTLPLSGTVVVASSGPAESSQEWDSLEGSLFTHQLLTGLRGDADADGNGEVTLAEAYSYAYRRTVAGARGGGQHPGFDFDLSGSGELVLSFPARARSALLLGPQLSGRYVISSLPRPEVVVEIDKVAGRSVRLAVPPGRYALRKFLGARTGYLELEMPYGGEHSVDESKMVSLHFDEVALKGGVVELHPWSVLVEGGIATPPFPSAPNRLSLGLSLRRMEGSLWGSLGVFGGTRRYRGASLWVDETAWTFALAGGWRWPLNPVELHAGLSFQGERYEQRFSRDREAEIARVWSPIPNATAWAVTGGPLVGIAVPLVARIFLWGEASGQVRYLDVEGEAPWRLGAVARLGIGSSF